MPPTFCHYPHRLATSGSSDVPNPYHGESPSAPASAHWSVGKEDFPDNIQSFEGGNPWTVYVKIKKRPKEWPFTSDRFVGEIYLDGEDDCWAKVIEYSMNDAAHKLARILQRDYQFKDINDYDKYDPWGKP